MSRNIALLLALALFLLALGGCENSSDGDRTKRELASIESYLKPLGDTVLQQGDLRYLELTAGTGDALAEGSEISLTYAAFALNGTTPQGLETNSQDYAAQYNIPGTESDWKPLTVRLGDPDAILPALSDALIAFAKRGTIGWVGIPSGMAFGRDRFAGVPPDMPLVYLVRVE